MMNRKEFLRAAGAAGMAAAMPWRTARAADTKRPNILWLSTEDISPHLGCYGDDLAITPTLDALAASGIRYERAYTTAPVCAPNRSCVITGMYSHSLGTQHMRSGGEGVAKRSVKPSIPGDIPTLPELLGDAGYYCTNNAKQDYNFVPRKGMWNESSTEAHWRNRDADDQPFFAVFNFKGSHEGTVRASKADHEKNIARLTPDQRQDPDKMVPPPFHPDTPIVRENWATYRENITALDYWVQDFLEQLKEDGLADNTIVIFWSDHGAGMPRMKRWCYQSGTHVPVMVHIPEALREPGQGAPGTVEMDLISSVDLAPTTLALAGLAVPANMQGQPFLGPKPARARELVYGGRDRMDERYEVIRFVRDARYTYIRNYMPYKPYDQFMNTAEKSPIKHELHRLAREGKLGPAMDWVTRKTKPAEEFYDLEKDPHEINNVADDPAYAKELARHRAAHDEWTQEIGDVGLLPEHELDLLGKQYGSRYEILNGIARTDAGFYGRLYQTATTAGKPDQGNAAYLARALQDPQAAIRYWGATGLGNLSTAGASVVEALTAAMDDASPTVRVAAALSLVRLEKTVDTAVALLAREASSEHEWIRLQAVTALDEIGEAARPAVDILADAIKDVDNKYVVRVANHAVNELLGRDNEVR